MKYEVGDKVKLVGTKSINEDGGSWEDTVSEYNIHKGDIMTIREIHTGRSSPDHYHFQEMGSMDEDNEFTDDDVVSFDSTLKGFKPRKVTHIIKWDTVDIDPWYICYSRKEMEEKVDNLVNEPRVVSKSIQVFFVSSTKRPNIKVTV